MSGTKERWQEEMVVLRHYVGAKPVWRTGGAGLGLCPHVGLVHELDMLENRCRECCPGMAQLGSHQRETPQVKGQNLLGPDRFPSTGILEIEQKESVWGFTQSRLRTSLVFRLDPAPPRSPREAVRGGAGVGGWDAFSLP